MKIVIISTIRNEADIIETFVRYHLQIADRLIIIDHRSADSSAQILKSLQEEGLPIDFIPENRLEFQQSLFLTHLMRKAVSDYGADWVLPVDADEFITTCGKGRVRDVIEKLPQDRIIKMPWRTYIPLTGDDFREPNPLRRIQYYRRVEIQGLSKIMIPRPLAEKKDGYIAMGSHGFVRQRFRKEKEFPYEHTDQLALAHFPVRSAQQIMTKAFVGWLACLAKPNKQPTEAFHIKRLYDQFKNGGQISSEELSAMAMGYATKNGNEVPAQEDLVHMPIVPDAGNFALRHVGMSTDKPVAVLAQLAEEYAEALAIARKKELQRKAIGGNLLKSMLRFWQ